MVLHDLCLYFWGADERKCSQVQLRPGGGDVWRWRHIIATRTTNKAGRFDFGPVPPGTYYLYAYSKCGIDDRTIVQVEPGTGELVDFVADRGIGECSPRLDEFAAAKTIEYCELLRNPAPYRDQLIRVRGLYETDFEKSILRSAACPAPVEMLWIQFDRYWEARTRWRLRRAINHTKWRVPKNVIFAGTFREGRFGHMDMYPYQLEVSRVEAVSAR